MMTSQPLEAFFTHIQLQAIIHQVEESIALDYAWLNFQRNSGQISRQDYYELLWEITADATTTEDGWEYYLTFAEWVTSLTNEYYVKYWFELETFLDIIDLKD
ncbi:hypothetical protein VB715_02625 [Crocosphaera sp. UHCC 0190]|uniref:hypothetical protein n=1 Tax=Crocosphaera sp. UHCC 0190 TaxID=3110246 RepID=UPI002B21FDA2|nr:hypothetical protein [Crocosphaera sp. UHCC 0190]MEA5508650.1 hypothetical protein [Crocosphaera sp. UHCC 0190]